MSTATITHPAVAAPRGTSLISVILAYLRRKAAAQPDQGVWAAGARGL